MQNIPSVEPFLVDKSITTNLDKKWNSYVDEFELFIVASGVTDKKQKLALLLHLGGKDLREIYKTVKEENDEYASVKEKLTNYFRPKKNITYERYVFKSTTQNPDESTASYLTRLKSVAENCDYGTNAKSEIRDHFIFTCLSTSLKKKLLLEDNLTLEKLLSIGLNKELSEKQATEISGTKTDFENVNKLSNDERNYFENKKFTPSYQKKPTPRNHCLNVEDNLYLGIRKNAQQLVKRAKIVANRIICQKFVLLQKISNLAVKTYGI